jgi:hypothetical protein
MTGLGVYTPAALVDLMEQRLQEIASRSQQAVVWSASPASSLNPPAKAKWNHLRRKIGRSYLH